jgi:A/G-specific adenine glycosylase
VGRVSRYDTFVVSLLKWGASDLRDLPWRHTRNPWHILVSEVMLQQTSVERVLPKFEAFIERFNTPHALADAALGDALVLWSGLGYPRRCRHLHRSAQVIVAEHGGEVPSDLESLLALPGIGQYTARAVQCFAHGAVVGVVDTNVSRVFSRLEGTSMSAKELQHFADRVVPIDAAWEWNQVLMDFGARHCTARSPQCDGCPVGNVCRWKGRGEDPAVNSAGASKPQAKFSGSDRQARGAAMRAVIKGSVLVADVIEAMQLSHDPDRGERLLQDLIQEGLLVTANGRVSLP